MTPEQEQRVEELADQCLAAITKLEQENERLVDTEQARWQEAIYALCSTVCEVDGKGCDSGDPLDFTLTEIQQAFIHKNNQLSTLRAQLAKLVEAAKIFRQDSFGFDIRGGDILDLVVNESQTLLTPPAADAEKGSA